MRNTNMVNGFDHLNYTLRDLESCVIDDATRP